MGRDLYDSSPETRALFADADAALGYSLSRIILEGPEAELKLTANTQPAIVLVSCALFRALGVTPAAVAGHSLGEYSALVAAGAIELKEALPLVHRRGRYMQEAVPSGEGAMYAIIGAEESAIEEAVCSAAGAVDIANYNAPGQIVIAGEREATRTASERCGARQAIELQVSAPFHCRLMRPAEERLAPELDATAFRDPSPPLYNNVDAAKVTTAAAARDGLKRQVSRPVRWTALIERMIADGIDTFVEIGPGSVLTGLIRRIDRNVKRLNVNNLETLGAVRTQLAG